VRGLIATTAFDRRDPMVLFAAFGAPLRFRRASFEHILPAMKPYVVHESDVPETEGAYPEPFETEKLSIYRDLGRAAGTKRIGFSVERLLPGRRTSFTHAHLAEEEIVYVMRGTCSVRIVEPDGAPEEIPLRAGHVVSFPPGTGIAHTFVNPGDDECVLI